MRHTGCVYKIIGKYFVSTDKRYARRLDIENTFHESEYIYVCIYYARIEELNTFFLYYPHSHLVILEI